MKLKIKKISYLPIPTITPKGVIINQQPLTIKNHIIGKSLGIKN